MDDGRAKNVPGDTGAPGDLLGALLSDGQLLERVSQIVAKTRAAESSAADNNTAPPDSSPANTPPPAMPDLSLLAALLGGVPASPTQDADDSPAVQAGSDAAGESGINAPVADTSGTPVTSGTSGASGTPDASATPGASESIEANEATAASAAPSNAPPDRLAGLTSLLTDSDFMAKLPGVLSMLSSGGGGSAGSGGKDGGKGGNNDGKSVQSSARGGPGGGHGGGRGGGDRCIALLSALKPYMSPRRCEAIDYLIRMNRMGDIIRRIR